jgi:hypothetical protein
MVIFDRAGYEYTLTNQVKDERSYVTYRNGTPIVVRNGKQVHSSFFTDGQGRWAKLLDCFDQAKVKKALSKSENPIIAIDENGNIVCQMVSLTGILWHDADGNQFYLISKHEIEELEDDGLGYITAESNGTYGSIRYIAFDGQKQIALPPFLYNEKNKKFQLGVNFRDMAYKKMSQTGTLSIARKNSDKLVYAQKAETGEFIMAHTNGAYEAAEFTGNDEIWNVEYCTGGGAWGVKTDEFFARYEFHSVDKQGRAIFIAKSARSAWVHLFGDFIACIPQWGDAMVAMSNPQVNITNPDDVYACSYIEFYGREDLEGSYIIVSELLLGAPEHLLLEFAKALEGYLETAFGIPKSKINTSNISYLIRDYLGIPQEICKLQKMISTSVAC